MDNRSSPNVISDSLLNLILPQLLQSRAAEEMEMLHLLTESCYSLLLCAAEEADPPADPAWQSDMASILQETGIVCFQFRTRCMGICQLQSTDPIWNRRKIAQLEARIGEKLRLYRCESTATVRVLIGRPFRGLLNLCEPYSELINSTMAFALHPDYPVISEFDVQNNPALLGDPYPRAEIERQFSEAVLGLEIRKAERLMDAIMEQERATVQMQMSFLPRMSIRLEWILVVLHIPRNSGVSRSADIYTYPAQVQYAESPEEGIRLIHSFFDDLDQYYSRFRFNVGKDISQITEFIRQESRNCNLSATMICSRFQISQSYLSRLFRKRTGVRLVDYINQVRIADARNLLETSDMSISDIALTVGYTSSTGFSTAFRRYESCSPREYREAHRAIGQPD